ncbi:VOC family protein [Aestuariicella hydrocarbonica]|uniref:VOC family protein n=1 Tax=Pseudomaricurvus hydrocarbonicus TaxID=1470433 RepID=A0A9E5JUT8_9GAMM|nr:VOC family protein [Aestuariicella hydrocarbonica]
MKEITRINHIGIRVANLEASRKFYEKLGFEFIAGPIGPEPVAIMEHPSGININFILNTNSDKSENVLMDIPVKHSGYTHMALEVTSLETVEDQLEHHGIEITDGPIVLPDGAAFIFVRDPDRNVIEFHKPGKR